MKVAAVIINVFLPGVGTLFVGKFFAAIVQMFLYVIGLVFTFTWIGGIIGIPLCFIVWVWSIYSAVSAPD
ncbi:MAG: hypothetical protein AAFQ42_11010 [Pseudomonadota bacterium]